MSIINLFVLIFIALLLSYIIGRDIEDTLPPFIFGFLLFLYGVAIIGKSHHSYAGSLIVFAVIWIIYGVKFKRFLPSWNDLKSKIASPAFMFYIMILMLMILTYRTHFVTVWDDFHYNATFPKDMYYYGTMPSGGNSATFYRSYLPLMQLFFYWGFQGQLAFSEPLMFWYKMFLIYTCMLPLIKQVNYCSSVRRICTGIVCVLLPFSFMYELMESLSMDTFMALLFGYAIVHIIFKENKDLFSYCKIILSLLCLTLVKQIAPVFTAISLGIWAVVSIGRLLFTKHHYAKKEQMDGETNPGKSYFIRNCIAFAVCVAGNVAAYLSWKIYCDIHGNSVYLSGKLADSISGGHLVLPEYGSKTISDFINAIFTVNMSIENNGLTLFIAVMVSIVLMSIYVWKKNLSKDETDDNRIQKNTAGLGFAMMLLGLFAYLLVLCYTFVFVFEQWEAESLSSIDRYFGTYALSLVYVSFFGLCDGIAGPMRKSIIVSTFESDRTDYEPPKENNPFARNVVLAFALLILVSFPWGKAAKSLVPEVYTVYRADAYFTIDDARQEAASVLPKNAGGRRVLIVNSEENSFYSRGLVYNLIPLVPSELVVTEGGNRAQELVDKCRDEHAYYVYFTNRLINLGYANESFDDAFAPGCEMMAGVMYYFDEDTGLINYVE